MHEVQEQKRAHEAREEVRRAHEAREEERRAQEARQEEVKVHEERKRQVGEVEAQEGKRDGWTRRRGAKKNEKKRRKMRIRCMRSATCRTDMTWWHNAWWSE